MQMSIIDYLLVLALLATAFYALYATLLRRPYASPHNRQTRKSTPSDMKRRRSTNAISMRRDATLHAFSR